MKMPESIRRAVHEYHSKYRHPSLPEPDLSEIYALFPSPGADGTTPFGWPQDWPMVGRPGVYFVFGPDMQLLYIGKDASLGRRLQTYFQYSAGRQGPCRVADEAAWNYRPTFVATCAVSETFEAPSFEEYLIPALRPIQNKTWASG